MTTAATTASKEKLNAKLITPEFRGSFVTLDKPKSFDGKQEPKYSMVIALPKDDAFVAQLHKMVEKVCIEKWGEVPKKLKLAIKDGDEEDEKYNWKGLTVFTASNKSKPGVVVRQEDGKIIEPISNEEIYSGAFYRASIRPYAYEYEKSKGVAISLDNVMKTKDGEKFTSRTTAKDDFADFVEGDWE